MRPTFYFIIVIFAFVHGVALGQSLPTKQQYDFLNWYVKHNQLPSLSDSTVQFTSDQFTIKDFSKTLAYNRHISKTDRLFLIKQVKPINRSAKLDSAILTGVDWEKPRPPKQIGYTESYISLPIFSSNGKIAFINQGLYCGPTCGHEGIEAYIKTHEGWKRYDRFIFTRIVF